MKTQYFRFLTLVSFVFSSATFAQDNFQGKAYYMSKTTMDLGEWGGREMSPDQKKRIEERMKNFLEKEYVLTFNKTESIYQEDEKLEAPGSRSSWGNFGSSFTGGPKYKNVKSKELLQDQEFFGKQFLIKDNLKGMEWKMGSETKQIGTYTCFKATAIKTVDAFDWRSMRRRNTSVKKEAKTKSNDIANASAANNQGDDPMSDIELPKTIAVTAWYTPQIPINQGPDDYWGLPGLILEVNADKTTILCTKIVMNPEEKASIEKPMKGDVVSQSQYNAIITKKMQEMRDMYGGRRGGGRRN